MKTKFYTFRQNNSGGSYFGPEYVIVEASSADDANTIAENHGEVYFYGVENDMDCDCCGDRWYPVSEGDGTETPQIYGDETIGGTDCLIIRLNE